MSELIYFCFHHFQRLSSVVFQLVQVHLIILFFSLFKGQTDSYKEGYKACLQRISAMLPQSNLETETRQRVNEFIQHSMVSATSSCQNCCAQNSRMISQMHQRLVSLRNNSSATESHSINTAPAPSQPQPVPQAAVDMWRPW